MDFLKLSDLPKLLLLFAACIFSLTPYSLALSSNSETKTYSFFSLIFFVFYLSF